MAIKKGHLTDNDTADVFYPQTSIDMVVDDENDPLLKKSSIENSESDATDKVPSSAYLKQKLGSMKVTTVQTLDEVLAKTEPGSVPDSVVLKEVYQKLGDQVTFALDGTTLTITVKE